MRAESRSTLLKSRVPEPDYDTGQDSWPLCLLLGRKGEPLLSLLSLLPHVSGLGPSELAACPLGSMTHLAHYM